MLRFETVEVAHGKGMHHTFTAAIRVRDVDDALVLLELARMVSRHDLVPSNHAAAIGSRELGLFTEFFSHIVPGESLEPGIEQIEDELAAIDEMPVNRCEARQLIF